MTAPWPGAALTEDRSGDLLASSVSRPHADASSSPRPRRVDVRADLIPTELRNTPRWVLWRYQWDGGRNRWSKVPFRVSDPARKASSTDPSTWASFDEAVEAYRQRQDADGIGIVLTADDDLVGVDLDGVIDPESGEIDETARRYIQLLDSYTEVSPSGAGLRIFLRGRLPAGGRKRGNVEVYGSGRYLTVTGHVHE